MYILFLILTYLKEDSELIMEYFYTVVLTLLIIILTGHFVIMTRENEFVDD